MSSRPKKVKGSWDWPKNMIEKLVMPASVTVSTQEGEAELPQFLLLLAGALDGPAGEALAVESPVVIAPDVSNTVVTSLVSLLSSGRTPSSVSVADEAAVRDLTSNLGLGCNFSREYNAREEQILSRGFRVVEEEGSVNHGGKADLVEESRGEMEDTSDERYAKMHKKGERWEKKVDWKQKQSARWQLRKEREMGWKRQQQHNPGEMSRVRLGPKPEAATHIYVEKENVAPVTIFGKVLPPIQDAMPFELPWLKNPVSRQGKSSGQNKKPRRKPTFKQLKVGGKFRKEVGGAEEANAKVQETGTVEQRSGGNIAQVNNAEENTEEGYVDQENNAYQESGTVLGVIPRNPSLAQPKAKGNVEGKITSASKSGHHVGILRVGEEAKEMMKNKNNRRSGVKSSAKEPEVVKSSKKPEVVKSSKKPVAGSLVSCKCCAFRGSGSALLKHLLIHYSGEMRERYKKAFNANRCPECGFSSSAKDNQKNNQKNSMMRHIGVLHKKVLKFMEN